MTTRLTELAFLPRMDTGAPDPAARVDGSSLYVSYVCANPQFPGWESGESIDDPSFDVYCALLRFTGVLRYNLNGPGEDSLSRHPLSAFGLRPYSFYAVEGSLETSGAQCKHWILAFHDESFEIVGGEMQVLSARVETDSPTQAIMEHVGTD